MKQAGRWVSIPVAVVTMALAGTLAAATGTADLRCNDLLAALRDGKYGQATSHFSDRMKAALGPDKLADVWQQETSIHGKLIDWKIVQNQTFGRNEVVIATLNFERPSGLAAQVSVDGETGEISGLYFIKAPAPAETAPAPAPSYIDSGKFQSEDVHVGAPPFELPGILTVPTGNGPWPAVVMLGGSGPNDKDESIGPNHPLKDIAEGLSSHGIVVLRYDKRTRAYGKKMDPRHTTVKEEYLDDAIAAVNFLRSRKEVARDRIFIAGHSLGATIAPEAALRAAPIQGLILLAPTGRKFGQTVVQQMRFLEEGSHQQLDEIERKANELDNHLMPPTENFMGAPASYFYDLDARDEVAMARQLGIPILILHGGRDYQVIDQDIEHWQQGLKGAAHVRVETFPDLNHLFIAGTGKPNKEEYLKAGHVDAKVIDAMTAFIQNPLSN